MLQRWKVILTNWMNCYFNKSEDEKKNLSIESLVTIISHLRENLSLDESKSSLLEAHTVEEFLCEKYPEFKFGNGTVEASNEEEICLSASVLLFFVCVNSKNLDIKNAMCSKLSVDNQETIMKYSKCLMKCPVITVGEVQAAITEACGQDIAALDLPIQSRVAETPPAMRSMHNNIRRLQAELEAERFDRNYLQEELSRTNNRLDQLLKEKEQYKLKILDLKAKISLCCGEDGISKNTEMSAEVSDKLSRQLHQIQLTLEETQAQLHDVEYERDQYKAKVNELKSDRDKFLELSQREYDRVSQLSDELETERRHSQSLKELVAELRQHNRLNGLDTSSLECDDPDSSIHSLPLNSSICSEACANVVEVQLGEERAKMVVLYQQIQMLQAQINELNQVRETEKRNMDQEVAQRENDICDLKHRINEEIEKKNNLKAHCDNEITKLNNEINELEQKLKNNQEYSKNIIERKMEEIQTLQEEKISLLHSLSNETTKLKNIIKELNHELDSEKQSRSRMKETYENHFMALNEKVLNRNNELVELQNSIFIKAEEIETLQVELRNEKEAFSKLMSQYDSLSEGKNILLSELRNERETCQKLLNDNQILNEQKNSLHIEVGKERLVSEEIMNKFQKISQEKDAIEKELAREQKVLKDLNNEYHDIEEQCDTLQNDLEKVKEAGKELQNKYHTLHECHETLKFEQENINKVYHLLQNKYQELEKQKNAMLTELNCKNEVYEDLKQKYDNVMEINIVIEKDLKIKKDIIDKLQNKYLSLEDNSKIIHIELQELKNKFEKQTIKNQDIVKQNNYVQSKLEKEKEALKELSQNYRIIMEQKNKIENDLKCKCDEEQNLKLDLETKVHSLKDKLTESENLAEKLKSSYESQIENLNVMVTTLSNYLKERTAEIDTLKADKNILQQSVDDTHKALKLLQDKLNTDKQLIERMTSEFESERQVLKNMVTVTESVMEDTKVCLKNEISELSKVKCSLEADKNHLQACLINTEEKYEATETAYTSVLSLLRLEKKLKQEAEEESEMVCENLDEVIRVLCDERKINAAVILTLESQKQAFTEDNEKLTKALKLLQDELNTDKQLIERMTSEFESERQVLKNMVTVTKSVIEDTKVSLKNEISELSKVKYSLEADKNHLQACLINTEEKYEATETAYTSVLSLLRLEKKLKQEAEKESEMVCENLDEVIRVLCEERKIYAAIILTLESQQRAFTEDNEKLKKALELLQDELNTDKQLIERMTSEFESERQVLKNMVTVTESVMEDTKVCLKNEISELSKVKYSLEADKKHLQACLINTEEKYEATETAYTSVLSLLRLEKKFKQEAEEESEMVCENLDEVIRVLCDERKINAAIILTLESQKQEFTEDNEKFKKALKLLQDELNTDKQLIERMTSEFESERQVLKNMVTVTKSVIEDTKVSLKNEISELSKVKYSLEADKNHLQACLINTEEKYEATETAYTSVLSLLRLEKKFKQEAEKESEMVCENLDEVIRVFCEERKINAAIILTLESQQRAFTEDNEKLKKALELLQDELNTDKQLIERMTSEFESERQVLKNMVTVTESVMEDTKVSLKNEISELSKVKCSLEADKKHLQACLINTEEKYEATETAYTSVLSLLRLEKKLKQEAEEESEMVCENLDEVIKVLCDERKINAAVILTLESQKQAFIEDNKKLKKVSSAQQLSNQLKKIVCQKNEEIADLKKQVTKMSATENRASQIIKVSSKYQAMILKRIAEIKSNTVLKELTNLGNSDNELRRSLNAGSVTMEDLENFLETTDRHLKRCAEKQIVLQKERDKLSDLNRINESEIINLKKFLTELSVSFQTFSSVKELYANKLIRVISMQRTVRRDILALDGRISDVTMCKLERGYGAVMQDLAECTMNLERWVERCISRTISLEKIKKAFTSDTERSSLSSPSFQNTGLEIQLDELEKSFQKLLEEIARAVKNEGSAESQAATVMEVRAEYEDKLNRMKAKMKDLFNEQMSLLKNKQKEEILLLERELQKARSRMEDSKRAYESHIKELTKELWNVGEKYLVKNDEAEWLRKKQRSGSLMSLQHVHSYGLVPPQELPSRPSDAHSLRSLPISENHPKPKREGRGLHMSDEEGEVFDNRYLKELAMTPRRDTGQRLSELKWRNSLCPPHLKSSYPAETQFAPTIDEDELKAGVVEASGARAQRKEVGITAYKKPGPPTPSKQAGRLSATDSELRESLRVDNDPHAQERKTSTPARFRAFLRLNKHDHSDGTPRRRLSNIFRKKY